MRYISCLLAAGLCIGCLFVKAQSAEDSVKATVNQLFTAMKDADPVALQATFADSAILQTIVTGKDGRTSVRTEPIPDFAKQIGKLPKGAADERIQFDVIKIDGALAMVWAPYSFYYNGQLNHCGADSFQLVRIDGKWKIVYIIDTRRKHLCE
jgi:hypothetical protein